MAKPREHEGSFGERAINAINTDATSLKGLFPPRATTLISPKRPIQTKMLPAYIQYASN